MPPSYQYDIPEECLGRIPEPQLGDMTIYRAMHEETPVQDSFIPHFKDLKKKRVQAQIAQGFSPCNWIGASVYTDLDSLKDYLLSGKNAQRIGDKICKGTITPTKHGPLKLLENAHHDWFQYQEADISTLFEYVDKVAV